ncbi:unnamed protein product [Euphydryas editha]|uniref:Uncharacterized protein n=1 Tax=Euphydryas editha TaxID=104508 RepID=A0AAU9UE79_EUPED|nr:unnamed protein product [Euphydryas editha]
MWLVPLFPVPNSLRTYNHKVDVAGRQVETGSEGAEDLDARLWPQREDCASDAANDGGADQVLRLRR